MFTGTDKTVKSSPAVQQKAAGTAFFKKAGEDSFFGAQKNPAFFGSPVQAKLTVSTPDDPQEREADAVAEKVMRMPEAVAAPLTTDKKEEIDRKEEVQPTAETPEAAKIQCKQEPEEKRQAKADDLHTPQHYTPVHAEADAEDKLQHTDNNISLYSSDVMRQSGRGPPAGSIPFEQTLASSKGGGSALPADTRRFMENRFDADFSGVRIHTGTAAESMNRQVNAQAFAHGSDIYFNSGKYAPGTAGGKLLLAHELTHTIQQGAGKTVSPKLNSAALFTKPAPRQTTGCMPGNVTVHRKKSTDSSPPAAPVTAEPAANNRDGASTQPAVKPAGPPPPASAPAPAGKAPANPPPAATAAPAFNTPETNGAPPAPGTAQQPAAAPAPPEAPAPQPGGKQGVSSPEYEQFAVQAELHRKTLRDHAKAKKETIGQGAEQEKITISQQVEDEATRLGTAYDQVIAQVKAAIEGAKKEISSNKESRVAQVQATAQAETENADKVVLEKQAEIKQVADQKAAELEAIGESEAKRAQDGSTANIASAQSLKARKIAEVRGKNNDAQLIAEIEQEASKVIAGFTQSATGMAEAARSRAREGTGNFRREGEEAAQTFSGPAEKARTAITGARDETVKAIESAASDSLGELQSDAAALEQKILAEKTEKQAQIRANADSIAAGVDSAAAEAKTKIDAKTTEVDEEAVRFKDKITEVKWAGPEIDTAALDLQLAVDQHNSEIDTLAANVVAAIGKGIKDSVADLARAVTAQIAEVTKTGAEFEAKSSEASSKVVTAMEEQRTTGEEEIKKPGTELGNQLQLSVQRAGEGWSRNVADSRNDIVSSVNAGLRKQQDALASFDSALSGIVSKAGSLLSGIVDALYDIGSFIGGVVVGAFWHVIDFFVAIWDMIKKPLFWVVVAIVAVVLIAAILYFGWAAVAGALAVIGKALVVIGIIIGVGLAIYYIYLAITKPDLSPYERGKYVGKAVVEALLAFAGTGIWSRLTGWMAKVVRIGQVLDLAGDMVKAARLLRKVGEVEMVLQLLGKVKDAEKLLQLLDKVKDAAEALKLLEKTTDIENLLKLIELIKNTDKVFSLLEKVGDAAKAVELFEQVKNIDTLLSILEKTTEVENLLKLLEAVKNADQVLALLEKSTDIQSLLSLIDEIKNVEKILALLEEIKDAKKLLELYGKVKDADRLLVLIKKIKDTKKLEDLLKKMTDAEQLERLLKAVDDVTDLEKLLQDMSAAELEQFIKDLNDANKVKLIAKKYAGSALKHYGAQFFKDFQGVDAATMNHLASVEGVSQSKGITGCHDEAMFLAEMAKQPVGTRAPAGSGIGEITNTNVHTTDPRVKKFTYQMWKQDGKGGLLNPLTRKADILEKTTINGLANDSGLWQGIANEAVDQSINTLNFPKGADGSFVGVAGNGLKWSGWYRGQAIQTIFVIF